MGFGEDALKQLDYKSMSVFNETSFTSWIVAALSEYLPREGYAFTPPSRNQGKRDAWKRESYPDLVQPFLDGAALCLEVKIANERTDDGHKLIHYKEDQREIIQLFSSRDMPIFYCYNDIVLGIRMHKGEQFLEKCICSKPGDLCDEDGWITDEYRNDHFDLKSVVDRICGEASGNSDFSRTIFNVIMNAAPKEPGVRTLLLAYSASRETARAFDEDEILFLQKKTIEFVMPNISRKRLDSYQRGKYRNGFSDYSPEELQKECDMFCEAFNRKWAQYQRQKNPVDRTFGSRDI